MAKRSITLTLTVKQAAALCDVVSYGERDMEFILDDDEPMITEKWLKLAGQGTSILYHALSKADPDWLEKSKKWREEK
jgi:hypothetical protein